jgi:integrase/recombinase XerD
MREFALEAWIAWNTQRGVRPITMNGYWRALRAFYKYRESQEGFTNPFVGRKTPPIGEYAPKALTAAECSRILLAAANYPWKNLLERELAVALLSTMLYSGLRRSELLHVLVSDVQIEAGTIRVVRGKGRWGGKDRMAYIPPELAIVLRSYVRERQRHQFNGPEFFVSAYTGKPIGEMTIRQITKKVSLASQIKFSPHVLRHSFVTHLLRSGVPLHIARDLAGHASIETTLGYLRVFDEDRMENVRKIRFQ